MWVPGKIALTAAVCGAAALAACSGPLDSPTPRPPVIRDAGFDFRRDVAAADRGSGGAGGVPVVRDASPDLVSDAFDAADGPRDGAAGSRMDAGDGGLGGRGAGGGRGVGGAGGFGGVSGVGGSSWPVVPGCVTGLQPQPFLLTDVSELVVGCPSLTRTVARVADPSGRGVVFTAVLDPPVDGFTVSSSGILCGGAASAPVMVTALSPSARRPGDTRGVTVRISIQGPGAPVFPPINLPVLVVAMDFALQDEDIDFGLVAVGTSRANPVTVINGMASAGIEALYPTPLMSGAFALATSVPLDGLAPAPLEPGATGTLLTSYFSPTVAGPFLSIFSISPYVPGLSVDQACGGFRTLTLRGQGYLAR